MFPYSHETDSCLYDQSHLVTFALVVELEDTQD